MLVGPVAALLGTMLVVVLGVYLQNRALERSTDLLRAELKQYLAEMELRITKQILELAHRVERLEDALEGWCAEYYVVIAGSGSELKH